MDGVADFYAGRSVFVTGATGFIGKVVLEKLLRSCPHIDKVYVLCRAKKDVAPQDRVVELMTQEVFNRAKKEVPGCAAKVLAIQGDITEDKLGIGDDDAQTLRDNVTVIIHIAATIKFTEKIQLAAKMNMVAVQNMIALAQSLKRCDALVHTSTAYTHTYQHAIPEAFIKPVHDPEQILGLLAMMDEDMATAATSVLIKQHPNTYTFTKCLAEDILKNSRGTLPVCVVRPSIVCPSWREPYPGWTDTFNGPPGLMTASGTGLLRTTRGHRNKRCDIVPVDIVATTLVCAGWRTHCRAQAGETVPDVYNCTTGGFNPCTWGEWLDANNNAWHKYPLEKRLLRSPGLTMLPPNGKLAFLNYWFSVASHSVPGLMLDCMARLTGKKAFSIKTYAKFENMLAGYDFFLTHDFQWDNGNIDAMMNEIPEHEQTSFRVGTRELNWQAYIDGMILGVKKYKMGEDVTERRLSKSRVAARNQSLIGLLVRIGLAVATLRTLVAAGYVRGSRLKSGSIYTLILAFAVYSKKIRFQLAEWAAL